MLIPFHALRALATACLLILVALPVWASTPAPANHPSVKRPFQLPPSATLDYAITARQSGLTLSGNARLDWQAEEGKFSLNIETRAMLVGKILDTRTEGSIDRFGLAPITYTEKRFRKNPTTVNFDRNDNSLRFSASSASYPLLGGEQDRNSIVWQLAGNARATPKEFVTGSQWQYFVAGQNDAEAWTFEVLKPEKIETPLGTFHAIHLQRMQQAESRQQQLDLWFAPALEWYPVRLRFTEANGDTIEQTLEAITKK